MRHVTNETPGARIRAARKAAGMTQASLAEETGIDRSAISNLERDEVGLGEKRAAVLGRVLNVSPQHLLGSDAGSAAERALEDRRLDDLLAVLGERAVGIDAVVAEVLQLLARRLRLAEQRPARANRRATGA